MTKQEFKKIMTEFVSLKEDCDKLNDAFKKLDTDFNYISFGRYENLLVKILELAMNDKSEWIQYWIYERDCGRDTKLGCVKTKSGKNIPIKTIDNLYDIINRKDWK